MGKLIVHVTGQSFYELNKVYRVGFILSREQPHKFAGIALNLIFIQVWFFCKAVEALEAVGI